MMVFTGTDYADVATFWDRTGQSTPSEREVDVRLGTNIHCRRLELGITREQIAAICQVYPSNIKKYEEGELRLSPKLLLQFARALKTDLSDIFNRVLL